MGKRETMKIKFLGTSASEGYPALFCECENCRRARELGGRNIRTRSSVLIDDEFLIDLPPEILLKIQLLGISLSKIRILAITHTHIDHFAYTELSYRKKPFSLNELDYLNVIGNPTVIRIIRDFFKEKINELKLNLVEVYPFEKYEINNYVIFPVKAVHITKFEDEIALNYVIQKGDKTILYGCDTGPYFDDTLNFLKRFKFDAIIFESTLCYGEWDYHMSFNDLEVFRKWLETNNILKNNGKMYVTHFSHYMCPLHEELIKILEPKGIIPAYDFLDIEV